MQVVCSGCHTMAVVAHDAEAEDTEERRRGYKAKLKSLFTTGGAGGASGRLEGPQQLPPGSPWRRPPACTGRTAPPCPRSQCRPTPDPSAVRAAVKLSQNLWKSVDHCKGLPSRTSLPPLP